MNAVVPTSRKQSSMENTIWHYYSRQVVLIVKIRFKNEENKI